jgi:hypothetical protein
VFSPTQAARRALFPSGVQKNVRPCDVFDVQTPGVPGSWEVTFATGARDHFPQAVIFRAFRKVSKITKD